MDDWRTRVMAATENPRFRQWIGEALDRVAQRVKFDRVAQRAEHAELTQLLDEVEASASPDMDYEDRCRMAAAEDDVAIWAECWLAWTADSAAAVAYNGERSHEALKTNLPKLIAAIRGGCGTDYNVAVTAVLQAIDEAVDPDAGAVPTIRDLADLDDDEMAAVLALRLATMRDSRLLRASQRGDWLLDQFRRLDDRKQSIDPIAEIVLARWGSVATDRKEEPEEAAEPVSEALNVVDTIANHLTNDPRDIFVELAKHNHWVDVQTLRENVWEPKGRRRLAKDRSIIRAATRLNTILMDVQQQIGGPLPSVERSRCGKRFKLTGLPHRTIETNKRTTLSPDLSTV